MDEGELEGGDGDWCMRRVGEDAVVNWVEREAF